MHGTEDAARAAKRTEIEAKVRAAKLADAMTGAPDHIKALGERLKAAKASGDMGQMQQMFSSLQAVQQATQSAAAPQSSRAAAPKRSDARAASQQRPGQAAPEAPRPQTAPSKRRDAAPAATKLITEQLPMVKMSQPAFKGLVCVRRDGASRWQFMSKAQMCAEAPRVPDSWQAAGRSLLADGHCCIDGFLADTIPGPRHAQAMGAQIQELYRGGGWRAGQTGGGRGGRGQRDTVATVRGDRITIAEADDPRLPALGELLALCDALVQAWPRG
jgi:hypothetical protein